MGRSQDLDGFEDLNDHLKTRTASRLGRFRRLGRSQDLNGFKDLDGFKDSDGFKTWTISRLGGFSSFRGAGMDRWDMTSGVVMRGVCAVCTTRKPKTAGGAVGDFPVTGLHQTLDHIEANYPRAAPTTRWNMTKHACTDRNPKTRRRVNKKT